MKAMLYNFNQSKMRCKKQAWQLEEHIWKWHLVFTDHMNVLMPKYAVVTGCPLGLDTVMNFGSGPSTFTQIPNAPPPRRT